MAEILLFHHVLGLTDGVLAFADDLRAAGHVVHTPDLLGGRRFGSLAEGVAHVEEIGFGTVVERGARAAANLPADLVHAGFSLGVLPAQHLAQTRPGARGAVLLHAAIPLGGFGPWPAGVPAQVHVMADDELGDVEVARDLAARVPEVELFLYPGGRHLFTDRGLPDHDPAAAGLVLARVLDFLAQTG